MANGARIRKAAWRPLGFPEPVPVRAGADVLPAGDATREPEGPGVSDVGSARLVQLFCPIKVALVAGRAPGDTGCGRRVCWAAEPWYH